MGHISYVVVIVLLVICSAFFSASETAFTSANQIRLKKRAEDGDKRSQKTLALLENYDKLLSTILIGNNIVNIGAASLATVLFVSILGDRGVSLSTLVLTIVTLIFGEISPKTLAKENPEDIAVAVTPILRMAIYVFTPLTLFFDFCKVFWFVYLAKMAIKILPKKN